MYKIENGQNSPLSFGDAAPPPAKAPVPQITVGSNKGWLILALIISIIAVIVSGYFLYKTIKSDEAKKSKESFGYRLY